MSTLARLSLLTITNPNLMRAVLLFVCSKMADETNLSSKLPVADSAREAWGSKLCWWCLSSGFPLRTFLLGFDDSFCFVFASTPSYEASPQTAMQQHVVEHGEHDKAQKRSWLSPVSRLCSRCPDTVLPLDPARSGRESEVDSARLSLTIVQFTAHAFLISNTHSKHTCKSYKSLVAMGERRSSRWGNTG